MGGTLTHVANLEKRGSYTPRRAREQRAYRLAVTGAGAGVVGVAGIVLAIAGVVGAWLPIIALLVAAVCAWGFMRTVGTR
jgi:CHASE2 domain-containing sensor protein